MSNRHNLRQRAQMFDILVKNAIDFFQRSITELEDSPKYSVINFYAALELFLKAKLMIEHWSLIITKPDTANFSKFLDGDFHSVGMDDAIRRLGNVAGEQLMKDEIDCFNQLREHRNKLVHFFHPEYAEGNSNVIQRVAAEQCKGWFYLHRLLTIRWAEDFHPYFDDIANLSSLMHKQREFLQVKYDAIRSQIESEKQQGVVYTACHACGFEALRERADQPPLVVEECLVCGIKANQIKIPCPNCGNQIYIQDMGQGECESCGETIDIGELTGLFDDRTPRESLEGEALAYCSECEFVEHPTVIQLDDKWLCLYCQTTHHEADHCEWCGELVTGNLEDSLWSGCVRCEGRAGHGFGDD